MHHIDAFWLYSVGIPSGCIFFMKMKAGGLFENEKIFLNSDLDLAKQPFEANALGLGFPQGKGFLPCEMKADPVQRG